MSTASPAEDLARALARFLDAHPMSDPWARYPAVLSVDHVGEILGVKPDSVGEAVRRGQIPMVKRLNRYVIDQVTFRAWLADRESSS